MEIWKDIKGFEGLYQISNYGKVKSVPRTFLDNSGRLQNIKKERFLKQSFDGVGYLQINLSKDHIAKHYSIHRLVAIHFKDNLQNLPIVNHLDNIKTNNHHSNLEWVSAAENICHAKDKSKTTSKYIGVSFSKHRNTWKSRITINSRCITIGSFKTEEDAYQARKDYEKNLSISNKYS